MIVQFVLASAVLTAVYYFSLATAMQDALVQTAGRTRATVEVMNGKAPNDLIIVTDQRFMIGGGDIVDLPRSFNAMGGAQFSYSFWVQIVPEAGDFTTVALLRGDVTTVPYQNAGATVSLPFTFSPMVVVSRRGDDTRVSCHVNAVNERNVTSMATYTQGGSPVNWTKWNLITVSVTDASLYGSNTPDALSCSVWVNQVESRTVAPAAAGGLVENSGNLFVLPTAPLGEIRNKVGQVLVRDLTYTNFAMSSRDVYAKIVKEADKPVVPYVTVRDSKTTQAFFDLSMQHMSV